MILQEKFLLACFVALIGSLGNALQGTFFKYYTNSLNVGLYETMFLRCFASFLLFLPFVIKYIPSFFKGKNRLKRVLIVLLLAVLYSADLLLYNTGLKTTPVNTGALIMLLVPLWMCFFGKVILHETGFNKITAISLLACICAVAYTIIGDFKLGEGFGFLFILANSIVLPIGVILQKKFGDFRPISFALFTNSIVLGLITFFMSNCNTGVFSQAFNPFAENFNFEMLKCAFLIAMFDVMESGGVYLSCKMAIVASLQPIRFTRIVFAVIVSGLVLGETVTKHQSISIAIILVANAVSIWYSRHLLKNKTNK